MDAALLDSHTLLWACSESPRLSKRVRAWLGNDHNRAFVSHATLWELSIKVTIGKLRLPEEFFASLPELGYEILNMNPEHLSAYRRLPLLHHDPFGRMLVAQAKQEGLALISCDPEIQQYPVEIFW